MVQPNILTSGHTDKDDDEHFRFDMTEDYSILNAERLD